MRARSSIETLLAHSPDCVLIRIDITRLLTQCEQRRGIIFMKKEATNQV